MKPPDTDELLRRVSHGDNPARNQLLANQVCDHTSMAILLQPFIAEQRRWNIPGAFSEPCEISRHRLERVPGVRPGNR